MLSAQLIAQGVLSIKSPKNLLQRHQSAPHPVLQLLPASEESTIYITQQPHDLLAGLPRFGLANHQPGLRRPAEVVPPAGELKSDDPEQRDSIFSLTSSSDSVYQGADLSDDPNGFCEKFIKECLECEDFRDSAVYSGDDTRADANDRQSRRSPSSSRSIFFNLQDLKRVIVCFEQLQRCGTTADSGQAGPLRRTKGGRKD
ncbi:uncharacterized protein LOC120424411 [Culex pipiens pallens]|uniref:uncharacterized protein LOC120424411 n=1 Tax=Culex pipiens pallens TaxID=42434 RepID=UPI001954B379|nr:uncharacterized protein LOC120424411 [Culex pipiens pallens]